MNYEYKALPWNILFGNGSISRLPQEIKKLGLKKALVLTTPNQGNEGQKVVNILGPLAIGLYSNAKMHVPVATMNEAIDIANGLEADCTVAIGGGSTTGLGKALAAKMDLPNIVLPTSYAGSEMTDIWAVTEADRKVTMRDFRVVPTLTIYDPELTLALPLKFAASSGLNAMAQAIVNIATDNPNPMISLMALEGVKALARGLPRLKNKDDLEAREIVLYGASLAGGALGTGVTSLHHSLCHALGGTFKAPHAETHAILLPHTLAYNADATKAQTNKIADALGVENAAEGIYDLAKQLDVPLSLRDIGIGENDIELAIDATLDGPINNPEPVTKEKLHTLLKNALDGVRPGVYH